MPSAVHLIGGQTIEIAAGANNAIHVIDAARKRGDEIVALDLADDADQGVLFVDPTAVAAVEDRA